MSFQITEVERLPGGHDDGTDDGVIVTKVAQGSLVKVPLAAPSSGTVGYISAVAGTATIGVSKTVFSNSDGTGQALSFTVPAVTSGALSYAYVEQTIYGGRIGVRFRRDSNSANAPFTVWVDGVPHAVRNVNTRRHAATVVSYGDYEALLLLAEDFGPGPHTVRLSVAGDVIGGASRSLVLYGFLADRTAGYEDARRFGLLPAAKTALTATATAIPITSRFGAIRKLYFHNTDTVTRTVTVTQGTDVLKVLSLTTATSAEVDFGEPVVQSGQLKWSADAAAVVNAFAQEAA